MKRSTDGDIAHYWFEETWVLEKTILTKSNLSKNLGHNRYDETKEEGKKMRMVSVQTRSKTLNE